MLQNGAIYGLIELFLINQNAGNTIDFKMNVIKNFICISDTYNCNKCFWYFKISYNRF